ncbi:MAG: exopolyphosphatase, partial [Rhodospirillaceae bacterium]|nr:exopolyphosphatase [Rhodospirillaceae bacterium]
MSRVPTIVFNEKVLCGLGRGLTETGRLDDAAVSMALSNLARFVTLSREMQVGHLDVVATAAVRDATNGREFVDMFERRSGIKVRVATGAEEAELAAAGVRSGIPDARGVIGDLGGGSLELVRVEPDRTMDHATLPLGPLRLAAWNRRRPSNSASRVDAYLRALPWLEEARGGTLYAVGGSWRAIARLHMAHMQYPLRVLHRFSVPYEEALEMAGFIARKRGKHLAGLANVGKERLELTPLAAFVMERVLRVMQPAELTFSALGLREGVVFSRLSEAVRKQDPLIEECRDIAAKRGRFAADGESLAMWMDPLFPGDGADEQRRRQAACWLADIA